MFNAMKKTEAMLKSNDLWSIKPLKFFLFLFFCAFGTEKKPCFLFILMLFPTFKNQSPSHHFGKLQTVQGENIVEDDSPEVGRIEQTADPA